MKVAYGEDELLQKWFRSTVALAFVPRRKVQLMFSDAILDEAPLEKYPQLEKFNDYMTETWIDDDSLFSSSLWNHFNNAESRVNNNNEGYNSRFNAKTSNVPHPNIWHFIEIIQKEEFLLVQMRYVSLIKKTLVSRGRCKVFIERDLK